MRVTAFEQSVTVDTWDKVFPNDPVKRRGHYFVYTPESLTALIANACEYLGISLELIAHEDPDTKVGNGFTLVYRLSKSEPEAYVEGKQLPSRARKRRRSPRSE
jgi:hypothetical protein